MTATYCTCSEHLDFSAGQTRFPASTPFASSVFAVLS